MPDKQAKPSYEQYNFISCSFCHGTGMSGTGICARCQGAGTGVFFANKFFYLATRLTPVHFTLRRAEQAVYFFLDLAGLAIGLVGVAALVLWYALLPEAANNLSDLFFWRDQSLLVLFFWLTVGVDMFLVYRLAERSYERQKISRRAFKEQSAVVLPNDWAGIKKYPNQINVAAGCGEEVMRVLENSLTVAGQLKHSTITPAHLFYSLLTASPTVSGLFARLNLNGQRLAEKLSNQLAKLERPGGTPILGSEIKQILIEAYLDAYRNNRSQVAAVDLLYPCYRQDNKLIEILYDLEVDEDKLINVIAWARINDQLVANYRLYKKMARFKPSSNMDRAYTAVATPFLEQFSYDLTWAAKYGRLDLCVNRQEELKTIFEFLTSGQHGVVLVGEAGVGKNAIVAGIAQLMVAETVPAMLKDKRLLELDLARLLGGADAADAGARLLAALNEAARAGNIILYLQDIENITGISSGGADSLDLSEILAAAISRQGLYCLATCTREHYTRDLENKPLGQALAKIEVAEPEDNEAIQIVESKTAYLENKHQVFFSYDALAGAVKLSRRYLHDQYLPAKAINILEKAAVEVFAAEGSNAMVTGEHAAQVVSEFSHVPVTKIGGAESQLLLNLENKIHERMVGQEEAVQIVAQSLRRARVELREGKRPIASFLFLGPTGVGKTELAKTIAQVYFGQEDCMIRLDMSEYQLADSVSKMIGEPSGTLGYLTEKVRLAPFSLVLLDEIEKAHPDILNLFLQVMDDGRLTDGQGRTIDFTNSIIIATSNIGAVFIQEQMRRGATLEQIKPVLIDKYLVEKMRPELINRFDGIVVFKPLTIAEVMSITRLLLNKTKALLEAKGIGLIVSDGALKRLASEGYEPEFGARPLRRLLQERIDDHIANKLLANEIKRRDTVEINDRAEVVVRQAAPL